MGGEILKHLEENICPFIDLIDKLRLVGIQKDLNISLPTIVVIGDQSSGKSSVLEGLSGVALPRGSGIVTRCPLELKLRKVTDAISWKATLSYHLKKTELVNSLAGNSASQNQVAGNGAGISDELITLEINSSDVCDLTLIDLPGIARVPVKGQPLDIGSKIKTLIMKYIRKPETLNMVVVPCNIDIATTEALKMAQEVDPEGTRTFAVLTKPDLIDKGTEGNVLAIAQNKVIPLRKGYIMVKCRGQQQIDENISLEEASQMERDFFKKHKQFRRLLTDNKATLSCLAVELTVHLVNHIKKSLPLLDEEVKKQLSEVRNEIKKIECGPPLDTQGAKQYLIKILSEFNEKIKFLSLGELIIEDNLFTQLRKEYKKWNDHLNKIISSFNNPTGKVKEQIVNNRGRELSGFSSYRVFESLLQDHVNQLKDPAFVLLNTVKDIVLKQFLCLSTECFQRYPNLLKITVDKIDQIQASQQNKAEERIMEQFEMENMICTQDDIFFKTLNENGNITFSEAQLPIYDIASKYSDMLKAYYKIMVQRMADQVPMLTRYFMLKEAVQLVCNDMLTLLEEADVRGFLNEDTDVSRKRGELQARLECLAIAQNEICQFFSGNK
ncbi:interferon-induced GTP-binding protein Mx3-like [Paramisgurnus dabryanus]|uniref:interferon-induced GTP-binding protein Mx3-like n=1 Tax=Paramisgurnus dabryanus TaxID=90735 RepID=UPI0031F37A8B